MSLRTTEWNVVWSLSPAVGRVSGHDRSACSADMSAKIDVKGRLPGVGVPGSSSILSTPAGESSRRTVGFESFRPSLDLIDPIVSSNSSISSAYSMDVIKGGFGGGGSEIENESISVCENRWERRFDISSGTCQSVEGSSHSPLALTSVFEGRARGEECFSGVPFQDSSRACSID